MIHHISGYVLERLEAHLQHCSQTMDETVTKPFAELIEMVRSWHWEFSSSIPHDCSLNGLWFDGGSTMYVDARAEALQSNDYELLYHTTLNFAFYNWSGAYFRLGLIPKSKKTRQYLYNYDFYHYFGLASNMKSPLNKKDLIPNEYNKGYDFYKGLYPNFNMDYYKFYRIMDAKITRKDGVFEPPSRLMATFLEDWVNGRITPSPCNTPAVTLREESYYGLTVKIRWPGYRFVRQFVPGKQPNFGEMGFCHYVTDYEYTYYFYKTADVFYAASDKQKQVQLHLKTLQTLQTLSGI